MRMAIRMGGVDRADPRRTHHDPAHAAPQALRAAALLVLLGISAGYAAPAAMAAEAVRTDVAAVAAGSALTVNATGFPASQAVELGAGPPNSDYDVIDTGRTDAAGTISFRPHISLEAPAGMLIVFVVATEDLMIKAASPPVEIVAAPGS